VSDVPRRRQALRPSLPVVLLFLAFGAIVPGRSSLAIAQVPIFGAPGILNPQADKDDSADELPRVATDRSGIWVVAWQTTGGGPLGLGRDSDIVFTRSPDNGATWTMAAPVAASAREDDGDDTQPVVATDGKGRWMMAWTSTQSLGGRGRDRDIHVSVSNDDAITWTTPKAVNNNATRDYGADEQPDIATDGKGRWVAVWQSTDSLGNTIGGDRDILSAVSTDGGLSWSNPVPVNTNAADDQRFDTSPRISTDGNGVWAVAWSSGGESQSRVGYERGIHVARSTNGGITWSDPMVLAGKEGDMRPGVGPRITNDARGHWVCAWASSDSLGNTKGLDRDVLVVRSGDDGVTWSKAAPINAEATRDAGDDASPELITDGHGSWLAVWTSWDNRRGTTGADGDIFVSISRDNGESWAPSLVLNSNGASDFGEDLNPSIATDGRGTWITVWDSTEPGGTYGYDRDLVMASGRFGGAAAGPSGGAPRPSPGGVPAAPADGGATR